MSREIPNLSIGQLIVHGPENFVDSKSAGIKMGEAEPFKDDPIEEVNTIDDKYPSCERWGFTSRYFVHACEDSPDVKRVKDIISGRQGRKKTKIPEA